MRNGLKNDLKEKEHICTMEESTDFLSLGRMVINGQNF